MLKKIDSFIPALPESILLKYNFFELYPLDGGGCFISREILGSTDDREIVRNIMSGALNEYGNFPDLDFKRFAKWTTIERDCWLNRMYFIVPLAKCGFGRLAMDIILDFNRKYSAPHGLDKIESMTRRIDHTRNERDFGKLGDDVSTEYQWYDFQPASRIINTLNAMCFCKNSIDISDSEWEEFDSFIHTNGEVVYLAEKFVSKPEKGNHQMLRALALLYAGCYLNEKDWIMLGANIASRHMSDDYLSDGMLHEISPSYHAFETWMCRDSVLLSEKYAFQLEPNALQSYEKACAVCRLLSQPDGDSLVINDGYPLNTDVFLTTIPSVVCSTSFLPEAGLAIINYDGFFVLLDSSRMPGKISHYHGGKNAVTIWFGGMPFVVDSGCCNYDDLEFRTWYKRSEAHSTLLVNGMGDSIQCGNCGWDCGADVKLRRLDNGDFEGMLSSSVWNGIFWKRIISVEQNLVISDSVSENADLEFVFVLHPDVSAEINGDSVTLKNGKVSLRVVSEITVRWVIRPGKVFIGFAGRESIRLCACMNGSKNIFNFMA